MSSKFFTAIYEKDGKTVVDISFRNESLSVTIKDLFTNHLDQQGIIYEEINLGDIATLLIHLEGTDPDKANTIVNTFYSFTENE